MFHQYRISLLLSACFLVLLAGTYWYIHDRQQNEQDVHFHASFDVYRDNTLVDFSGDAYMHIEPCGTNEHAATPEENQLEKAHLHDNIGDVVHVHRKNARWKDLFKNIGYDMNGTVIGYVNGERVFGILNKVVHPYDRALFLLGDNSDIDAKLNAVPSVDAIKQVEQMNESC